jgi:hypothetical protein
MPTARHRGAGETLGALTCSNGLPRGFASTAQTAERKAEAGSQARCFSRHEVAAELSTGDLARKARGQRP